MPLSPLRLRLLVAALLTVSFLGALDHTVVSTSLATIAGELNALQHMGWIVVSYTLASTVLLPVLGRLGDMVGAKPVFLTSLGVFLAASLACGFAPDMTTLLVARVVQGMSAAGIQLLSQTILAHATTPRQRPRYMSIIGAAFPIAILIGPVIGGAITDFLGWQWVFWINVPIGLAAMALAFFAIPSIPGAGRARFDVPGTVTFTVALVALVLGATWAPDPGLLPAALTAFGVALVVGAVFVIIQLRTAEPLVPFQLFANRTVAAGITLSAIIGIGLFSITAYLPTYIQMAYRTSATISGLVPIATVFGMLVSNLTTGWLASRTGHYRVYPIIGTALGAAGLLVMASLPAGAPLWVPMVVMAVVGLGTGSFMSLVVAVVQSAVPRQQVGSTTATINLVRQIGSTITTAVIGGVIAAGVASLLPAFLDQASLTPALVSAQTVTVQTQVAEIYSGVFAPIFAALAVVYAVGIVAAILLPGGTLSDEHHPEADAAPVNPVTVSN